MAKVSGASHQLALGAKPHGPSEPARSPQHSRQPAMAVPPLWPLSSGAPACQLLVYSQTDTTVLGVILRLIANSLAEGTSPAGWLSSWVSCLICFI